MSKKIKRALPGDKSATALDTNIASMIRVNHAGEYGAKRIYQGQLSVLGKDKKIEKLLRQMAEQEQEHLEYFENEITTRRIRPTALHPLWHTLGFMLGAATARLGVPAAMACTVAVETVISEHYQEQLDALKNNPSEKKLRTAIQKFKNEEEEHHDIGLENNAKNAPAYRILTALIKGGAKMAIRVAKRV